jgi:hypothetical protein
MGFHREMGFKGFSGGKTLSTPNQDQKNPNRCIAKKLLHTIDLHSRKWKCQQHKRESVSSGENMQEGKLDVGC